MIPHGCVIVQLLCQMQTIFFPTLNIQNEHSEWILLTNFLKRLKIISKLSSKADLGEIYLVDHLWPR
jgi:hypothetical protein